MVHSFIHFFIHSFILPHLVLQDLQQHPRVEALLFDSGAFVLQNRADLCGVEKQVLRIRDIFVRIRTSGSKPLTMDLDSDPTPAPDPAYFVSDLQDGN
jgi:hypothetical protein